MRMRRISQYLRGSLADARNFLLRRDRDLPPVRYRRIGAGDFREMGDWLAALLVRQGLQPGDRVLDIGCGIGRVALALTPVLNESGRYEGFDADARAIRWCAAHFTPRHPRFRFTHADVASYLHPRGTPGARYRFPFEDGSFDFAWAFSVFTHLELDVAANYFCEAQRVLRPGGLLVATAFLTGEDGARPPGSGAALPSASLETLLPAAAWSEVRVERGTWRETGSFSVKGQDLIVATKR